jgi:hypothetical protein
MCRRHWFMVPRALQAAVWKHYRPGQCDDKQPSKEWHEAADAAIAAVWASEQRSLGTQKRKAPGMRPRASETPDADEGLAEGHAVVAGDAPAQGRADLDGLEDDAVTHGPEGHDRVAGLVDAL